MEVRRLLGALMLVSPVTQIQVQTDDEPFEAAPLAYTRNRQGEPFGSAQGELRLTLRRNFGFRAGDAIQGNFTLGVEATSKLVKVTFLIDGLPMVEIGEAPFQHRFNTNEYDLGQHILEAAAVTDAGEQIESPARTFEFVSAEAGWRAAGSIGIPLLVAVIVLMGLGSVGPALLGRRRAFRLGKYGSAGGAVCPRCELPYTRSLLSPNLGRGKLERCPHCGKWAVVRRASQTELQEAERKWQAEDQAGARVSPSRADQLRRMVEESHFED